MSIPANTIVAVNTERRPLSERLPGMPITRRLLLDIEHEIACIEREREIRRDLTLQSGELELLRAYKTQVEGVMERGQ